MAKFDSTGAGEGAEGGGRQRVALSTRRHSAAHVLAQAVRERWPAARLAIGPDTENGFFYDIEAEPPMVEQDLKDLEKRMKKIVGQKQRFEQFHLPTAEARAVLEKEGATYKLEMAGDLAQAGEKEISFYKNVSADGKKTLFVDMCSGPHVAHTGELGAFRLSGLSGAYWKGQEDRPMLQRVYGLLFETQEELDNYEKMLEEARKRDHRRLGQDLELFATSEKVGPGLIFWLPRGNIIKEELERWAKETEAAQGYQRVTTPNITKEGLFQTSEHLPHYSETMFPPMQMDNENYYLKPMNCPFHHTIYGIRPRSYRELPVRLAEYGTCHRFEDSGSLLGLMRVRAMSMNDAHIYCTEEQAAAEFINVMKLHRYYYDLLDIQDYWMVLALRNPKNKKYHGDNEMWEKAERITREAMEASGIDYIVEEDGAAFYGPKVDFQIKSSIGREFTASTCQLDLFMPMKFDLKYVDRDGQFRRPACIHRAPLGTHERFVGFLIEHFAGAFPLWLAPEQVRILPVGEGFVGYAKKVEEALRAQGIRVSTDIDETLGKRIRQAEKMKIPYMLVVGEKEQESGRINARNYFTGEQKEWEIEAFLAALKEEIESKHIQKRSKG